MSELAVPHERAELVTLTLVPARPASVNPYHVYLRGLAGESVRTMRGCLDRLAVLVSGGDLTTPPPQGIGLVVPWERMTYPIMAGLRSAMIDLDPPWSANHINKHLVAARGVIKTAWRLGLIDSDQRDRACDVKNIKAVRLPAGRSLHEDEIAAMFAACLADEENSVKGARDAAMFAFLWSTGGRRAEVAGARIERYDPGERGWRLIGKGNKERMAFIHQDAVPYIDAWLVKLGTRTGPLMRPVDRWGHIGPRAISARNVGMVVNERRLEAGLPPLSPHDWRRTFIGAYLDANGDLSQAQRLAGHASADTTGLYDRRPDRQLRAGVDKLSLPSPDQLTHNKGNHQ